MTARLRTLIVEDEPYARDILKHMLKSHRDVEIVAEAASIADALQVCESHELDLIFLDIGLGSESGTEGFEVAQFCARKVPAPSIVFVTGRPEYALAAHEHHPAFFLLKPVAQAMLDTALQRVRQERAAMLQGLEPTLAIPCGERDAYQDRVSVMVYVRPRDILFIQTNPYKDDGTRGGTLTLYLRDEVIQGVWDRLSSFEGRLSAYHFFRIHNSYLINLRHVKKIKGRPGEGENYNVLLAGWDKELPVSRHRLESLRAAMASLYL